MSWRLEAAAEEATRMVAMLRRLQSQDGADCAQIRAEALRDALALVERDAAEAEEEEAAPEAPEAVEPAPDPAPAPAAPAAVHGPSAEQQAVLRETWSDAAVPREEVLRRYNAAGPHQVRHLDGLYYHADKLGLVAPKAPSRRGIVWTKERDDALARDWPTGATMEEMVATVAALPGAPITKPKAVEDRINALRLRRSPEALAHIRAEKAAEMRAALAASRVPAPEAPPPPAEPPPAAWQADPLGTLAPDERADAEAIILVQKRGARAMAEEFDWPLDRCQAIAEALRLQAAQPQGAAA